MVHCVDTFLQYMAVGVASMNIMYVSTVYRAQIWYRVFFTSQAIDTLLQMFKVTA